MPVHRTCERCARDFAVPPSEIKTGGGRFCSVACRHGRRQVLCAQCGATFLRKRSHVLRRDGPTYCDLRCKGLAQRAATVRRAEQSLGEPLATGLARLMAGGATMRDICRACGINDDRVVKRMMTELGIATRTPREAVLMQWVNNPERRAAAGRVFGAYARADPERTRAKSIKANIVLQTTRPTRPERHMIEALDAAGIAYVFQHAVGGKFLCDFGFPDAMLIVEVDGSYWHRTERQQRRDASKTAYLEACGYTVLRFSDDDVTHRLPACLETIQDHLLTLGGRNF